MSKHSSGPWRLETFNPGRTEHGELTVVGQPMPNAEWVDMIIAHTDAKFRGCANEEEIVSNYRLIAAGPELLEACKCLPLDMVDREYSLDAAEFVDNAHTFIKAMKKAKAAIEKAEGNEVDTL